MGAVLPLLMLGAGALLLLAKDKTQPAKPPVSAVAPIDLARLFEGGSSLHIDSRIGIVVRQKVVQFKDRPYRLNLFRDGRFSIDLIKPGSGVGVLSGNLATIVYDRVNGSELIATGSDDNLNLIRLARAHIIVPEARRSP